MKRCIRHSLSGRFIFLLGMFFIALLGVGVFSFLHFTQARNITFISDTLSTSGPSLFSNHRIEFTLGTEIPANGFITITPEDGAFTIPTSTFSHTNVELYVSTGGGSYSLRTATTTPDATDDGITIVDGTSGSVTITLNSTTGISAGSDIRILIGNNTSQASTTIDTGWQNPSDLGSYRVYVDAGGGEEATAHAMIAIVDQVNVGPIDTTETEPPYRYNPGPTGSLPFSTAGVEISLSTDEFAECRYSLASGTPYFSMIYEFETSVTVVHAVDVEGFSPGNTYTYYVRCIDDEDNFNTDDFEITFSIAEMPTGDPGTGSSTDSSGGGGAGTGSGSSGSGSGSSSGGGGGGGSGGGGGGGGSKTGEDDSEDGGGGFESNEKPYASGDARVIITGYAFPGSTVSALVDGYLSETARASSQGVFEITIDAIARGVYTFGVYATDSSGVKSSTFSTSFSVIGARTSNLSNIHIMPTIKVNPNPVEPGAQITFSGYAIPSSVVTIEAQPEKSSAGKKTYTTNSDSSGRWSLETSTQGFSRDTWKVRAKSSNTATGVATQFSGYTFFSVGNAAPTMSSDLNRDGKVNLVDFSILLFHWNTNGGNSNPPADINRDGRVTLTDFSIMIFNWTG